MIDPEETVARAVAAHREAERLAELVHEMRIQTMVARAEHLLIQHTPAVEARLRLLLEDGLAAPTEHR